MKHVFRMLLVALICVATSFLSTAQVSGYTFAQSTTTYSAITGTALFPTNWDDNVQNLTLPFSFQFNGASYTAINVSSNGFITFGATAPTTTGYAPISGTTAYSGAISALGRDLIVSAAAETCTYTTLGTAPNRTFVVQWNNARRYTGNGGVAGDVQRADGQDGAHSPVSPGSERAGGEGEWCAGYGIENAVPGPRAHVAEFLPWWAFAFRSAAHAVTGFSPYAMMMGREPRLPLDVMLRDPGLDQLLANEQADPARVQASLGEVLIMKEVWEVAWGNHMAAARDNKAYYDQKATAVGTLVWPNLGVSPDLEGVGVEEAEVRVVRTVPRRNSHG
jgi:hypothetical protein